MIRAALDGVGLAYSLEDYVSEHIERGELVRVLEDWCPPFDGYFLYYPSRRHPAARPSGAHRCAASVTPCSRPVDRVRPRSGEPSLEHVLHAREAGVGDLPAAVRVHGYAVVGVDATEQLVEPRVVAEQVRRARRCVDRRPGTRSSSGTRTAHPPPSTRRRSSRRRSPSSARRRWRPRTPSRSRRRAPGPPRRSLRASRARTRGRGCSHRSSACRGSRAGSPRRSSSGCPRARAPGGPSTPCRSGERSARSGPAPAP